MPSDCNTGTLAHHYTITPHRVNLKLQLTEFRDEASVDVNVNVDKVISAVE